MGDSDQALAGASEEPRIRRDPDMSDTAISQLLRPPSPCTVVIFGAAGDLTKRKLIPALYNLKVNGLLPNV